MITCESGKCKKKAKYLVNWTGYHPCILPFGDQNFLCEEHLRYILRVTGIPRKTVEIYELFPLGGKIKVEFT